MSHNLRSSVQRCSFCGRNDDEVTRMVAGVGVYICADCVSAAHELLASPESRDQESVPEWEGMSDQEVLAHLPRIASLGENVEAGLQDRVADLRHRGLTWARIGEALSMSRQSAWERFSVAVADRDA